MSQQELLLSTSTPAVSETVAGTGLHGCTPFVAAFGAVTALAAVQMVALCVLVAVLVRMRKASGPKFLPTHETDRNQPVLLSG